MSNNLRFGCNKCAPYLTRQKIPAEPLRPKNIINGNDQLKMKDIENKEIAYNILNTLIQNYQQQNFIAFLERDDVFDVASQILQFLNDGQQFLNHKEQESIL